MSNTTTNTSSIRIYVADLKDYNNGILSGQWFDLADYTDFEDLQSAVNEMLKDRSKETGELHEEWALHDYEAEDVIINQFLSEWSSFEDCFKLHDFLYNTEYYEPEALGEWLSMSGYDLYKNDVETLRDAFEESYCGQYEDGLKDYVRELVNEGCYGDIQESIKNYIDYEAIARDLGYDGYWETNGHVFRPY